MGRDKATLPFRGVRLIDHTVALARSALAATGREGAVWVSGSVAGLEDRCIPDETPGLGPLGGLLSSFRGLGLRHGFPFRVVVIPVDMPGLSVGTVSCLLDAVSAVDDRGGAAYRFGPSELPASLRVGESELKILEQCLTSIDASDRSVRKFLKRLGAQILSSAIQNENEFQNANTPGDFAVWEAGR